MWGTPWRAIARRSSVRPGWRRISPAPWRRRRSRPVIGVPIASGPLAGFDALLSTVQMPGGIPVATVAVDEAGARNAGYLAAQIVAVGDAALAAALVAERQAGREKVHSQNASVQRDLGR